MPAIGIDLGTSNSCVAVSRNGQVNVIANDQGSRLTPSFISFTEDERLVGEAAKLERSSNIENTLYQIKRLIGRTYDDPVVQADMKTWGFKVVNDDNKPTLFVSYKGEDKYYTPEQVSAMVLESIKTTAEDFLGETVTDAIITVPAYFNDAQRSATRDAGVIAGLNVLRMINEPTAAAIAYGLDRKGVRKQTALIYDLGGGTFDVTIVNIEGSKFDVIATGGDTHLGGDDFDNRLANHFVAEFNRKNNCDMSKDKRALNRLRVDCEIAKKNLSQKSQAKINIDYLYNGINFKTEIRRATFEELNRNIFNKTIEIMKKTLSDANLKKNEIDEIVIVGGSTRIPKIQELLQTYFGKPINKMNNLDEAVAYGAGALAAKLDEETQIHSKFKEIELKDVLPLSLGFEDAHGEMVTVLPRNSKLPTAQINCTSQTNEDFQTGGLFNIYEGERVKAEDNNFLGSFSVYNIPARLRGVEKFSITFSVDESGILTASARNVSSGIRNEIVISNNRARLSAEEVEVMKKEAEQLREADNKWKMQNRIRNELEDFAYEIKHSVDRPEFAGEMSSRDRERVVEECAKVIDWARTNRDLLLVHECSRKRQQLKENCYPIFAELPGGAKFLASL